MKKWGRKVEPTEASSREKLMQSAERLFAQRGFDGVSVRDISNDAKVNSALVGYYFGSKEGLLTEVYNRHCQILNAERAQFLSRSCGGGRLPSLEEVLEAFIRPSLKATRNGKGSRTFSRLRAILAAENSALLDKLVARNFDASTKAFVDAFCTCLPHLNRDEVFWRFHFLLGTIYYSATGPQRVRILTKGRCNPSDRAATSRELIPFLAAGFRAPSAAAANNGTRRPGAPDAARRG